MTPSMSGLAVLFWIANVVLDCTAHVAFKFAAAPRRDDVARPWKDIARSPQLWLGIACSALEFAVWFALLSLIPLSQAVLIGSINIVVVMIAGRVLFGERLHGVRVAGTWLIALGVALAGT